MEHLLLRMWENLGLRISGPMKFRLVMQPAMALFLAIRGGLKDARHGKSPYFWTMFTAPAERRAMLQDGWKSVGRLFVVAIVMDAVYQLIVQRWVYPGEAVVVATILAIVPYLLIRGPVNRIARLSRSAAKERKTRG
jgi:hypothetical protein